MLYKYGMRLRGFSPGCQPKDGLVGFRFADNKKYYDYLFYNEKLSEKDLFDYNLDYIGTVTEEEYNRGRK